MRITLNNLQKMAQDGNRIAMLTCYDASFAALLGGGGRRGAIDRGFAGHGAAGPRHDAAGDPADMVYHTACVARGASRAFIIGDLPFGTFQVSPQETFRNAAEIMAAGAHMVKLEGGRPMLDTIEFLTARGIPVCGHIGLTPQSVYQFGG